MSSRKRPLGKVFLSGFRTSGQRAFTVTELLFVTAAVGLLLLTAAPLLGNSKLRSDRLTCGNNLRQIGVAFQTWADSHEDRIPWLVSQTSGGTSLPNTSLMDSAWYHYLPLSNTLSSPRLLACPSDVANVASKWDFDAAGGFLNPAYRNNSVSYLVGCHAEIRLPQSVLAGDRNIIPDSSGAGCSVGFRFAIMLIAPNSHATWNSSIIHGPTGNILSAHGGVTELSSLGLQQFVKRSNSDNGSEHYLLPR
jgi:type II secretory pathway pseudopilin PulG